MSEETPTQYEAIYSDQGRIFNRIPQINDTMLPQLVVYQQYIDSKINNKLRAVFGNYDKNRFYILLPLSGQYDVIDIKKMAVQLAMDAEIQMASDNCIIAMFRSDTAENDEKVSKAEDYLIDIIERKYGGAISTDIDFTTKYLKANKVTSFQNGVIALFSGAGVLLSLSNSTGKIPNSSNPDSRVIFLPASSFL